VKQASDEPPPPKQIPKPVAKPEPRPAAEANVAAVPPPPKPAPVAATPAAPPKTAKPAAKAVSGGGYRVQIASLRTAGAAKREWAKRVKQSGGVLAGLTLFVKRVDIPKKGTYFRVQAGPLLDKTAARRVCDTLKQRKISCFVVKP
jgi:cell division septation protein DedD